MIHAIPFKVVHPCPRPRAVPPRVATTTTSRRSRPCLFPLLLPQPRARARAFPFAVSFLSSRPLAPARSFAHPCAHMHARTLAISHLHTHSFSVRSLSLSLSLSCYPPTGSLFLRVTTQWRCHTLAPSSNQCYCFIVPLLLLLLDTRKGDPSIPESVRERGAVASLRLALSCLVLPCLALPCLVAPRLAPHQSERAES